MSNPQTFQNLIPQAIRVSTGQALPFTNPSSSVAINPGTVVVVGTVPTIVDGYVQPSALGSVDDNGVFDVVKDASTFSAGDVVYWNPTGNPNLGTAGTGCATSTAGGNNVIGWTTPAGAALTGDNYVRIQLKSNVPYTAVTTSTLTIGASTAAAGSTYANAGALPAGTAQVYPVTGSDGTKGVIISTADKVTGRTIKIGNEVSTEPLIVYGPAGAVINGAAANAGFTGVSGAGVTITCLSGSGNTWLAQ